MLGLNLIPEFLDLSPFMAVRADDLLEMEIDLASMKAWKRALTDPLNIPRGSGSILYTESVTGILGGIAQHSYSISKFTVAGLLIWVLRFRLRLPTLKKKNL
ncbi:hypothetical protein LXL04_011632 [Taraxacum kok-saghyz]